jgi:hypothetical protein
MGLLIYEVEGFVCLQAAIGAFGITGLMGTQATIASWAKMQNIAAVTTSFYQSQSHKASCSIEKHSHSN